MFWVVMRCGNMRTPPTVSGTALKFVSDCTPSLASCDKCNNRRAFFYQLQIRSADEPMTTCTFVCSKVDQTFALLRSLYLHFTSGPQSIGGLTG